MVASLAGTMFARGMSREAVESALLADNARRFSPPLSEEEVRRTVESIARYTSPGSSRKADSESSVQDAALTRSAGGVILRFYGASEIDSELPGPARWVAKPYVAPGAVTELAGKVKAAGKTTFLTHMCAAILEGSDFLGQLTDKSAVVYLTEQPKRSFLEALRRAGLEGRDDFRVAFWVDTIPLGWQQVVDAAVAEALRVGAKLLVVDTLPQFAGLRGDGENSAGDALAALKPLQEATARHDIAVVVVRHERKSSGDIEDAGRGSSAFAGGVDILMALRRPEGAVRPTLRVIYATGRFSETPSEQVIELTDHGYVALGSGMAVAQREAMDSILAVAPTSEDAAMTLDELASAAGDLKRTTAQDAVRELLDQGTLCQRGEGRKGSPYRYWRHPSPSQTPRQIEPSSPTGQGDDAQVVDGATHLADESPPDKGGTEPEPGPQLRQDDDPNLSPEPVPGGPTSSTQAGPSSSPDPSTRSGATDTPGAVPGTLKIAPSVVRISPARQLERDWATAPGQIWEIDSLTSPGLSHRLMCGDSTDWQAVCALMAGREARWMWTDPPYGVDYKGKTGDGLRIAGDSLAGLQALLQGAFANADRVLVPGAPIYIAHPGGGKQSRIFHEEFDRPGWLFHQPLIWVKDRPVLGRCDHHYRHEPLKYGWKPTQKGQGRHPWYGGRKHDTVFEFPNPKRSALHPTMKPVELIMAMIRNSTLPGEIGYEPFAGSGSTLLAAEKLGRVCYAMELAPEYAAVCLERLRELGLTPRLVGPTRDELGHQAA
jgi:DNA modification methylase